MSCRTTAYFKHLIDSSFQVESYADLCEKRDFFELEKAAQFVSCHTSQIFEKSLGDPHILAHIAIVSGDAGVYRALVLASKHFAAQVSLDERNSAYALSFTDLFAKPKRIGRDVAYYLPNLSLHRGGDRPACILKDVYQFWFRRGKLHRDGDNCALTDGSTVKMWFKEGKLHRDYDRPSKIYKNGIRRWLKNGLMHREGDLPAVVCVEGRQWFRNGVIHRDGDLPAEIYADGERRWSKNGEIHRDLDLPAIIEPNGTRRWYSRGLPHRRGDKPAVIEASGTKRWYWQGKLHRECDKPAVVLADGTCVWLKHGKRFRANGKPSLVSLPLQYFIFSGPYQASSVEVQGFWPYTKKDDCMDEEFERTLKHALMSRWGQCVSLLRAGPEQPNKACTFILVNLVPL